VRRRDRVAVRAGPRALFVGPADMSAALDVFAEWEADEPTDASERVVEVAEETHAPVGTLTVDQSDIPERVDRGFDCLIVGIPVHRRGDGREGDLRVGARQGLCLDPLRRRLTFRALLGRPATAFAQCPFRRTVVNPSVPTGPARSEGPNGFRAARPVRPPSNAPRVRNTCFPFGREQVDSSTRRCANSYPFRLEHLVWCSSTDVTGRSTTVSRRSPYSHSAVMTSVPPPTHPTLGRLTTIIAGTVL